MTVATTPVLGSSRKGLRTGNSNPGHTLVNEFLKRLIGCSIHEQS